MNPEDLNYWIGRLRAAMLADPQHHLPWRERRASYEALGDAPDSRRLRGWLAILSAQRVLPIVLTTTPWDAQPLQNLDAAIRFLSEEPYPIVEGTNISVEQVLEASYLGNSGGYDRIADVFRYDIARTGAATHKSLLEATGHLNSFDSTKNMHGSRNDFLYFSGQSLSDEEIVGDDEDWAILAAVGDAAGAAAVASACTSDSPECDPTKLYIFWTWWLDEAIPFAAKIAEYSGI